MVKNLPANAGDTGLIRDPGRFHMLRSHPIWAKTTDLPVTREDPTCHSQLNKLKNIFLKIKNKKLYSINNYKILAIFPVFSSFDFFLHIQTYTPVLPVNRGKNKC